MSENRYRKGRKGGGVTLYINESIPYKNRNELEHFDSELESLFIEISKEVFQTSCDIIIGVLYRMPNSSIEVFNDRITDILNVANRENKLIYLLGDINIDFLKTDEHSPTSSFVDTLYSYNVFPLITKPTRVTKTSATLIDHILTNNLDSESRHKQGILCTDISDHYAVFHISKNNKNLNDNTVVPILKRDMRLQNVQTFVNEINAVNWEQVTESNDPQMAYSEFHKIISLNYNKSFPYRKLTKKYHNNKPWLTASLKESIRVKNKLYKNRNKGSNHEERLAHYKMYRNKLNHILRAAERKHFKDQILEHKANLKKSWQIIKMVINKRKYKRPCAEFKYNGKTIKDGVEISNKFNNFFVNVGSTLASAIPASTRSPIDYIRANTMSQLHLSTATENEVLNIIGNFKNSSAEWDELKPNIMKNIRFCVKMPLTHICNLSFQKGVFPTELKIANVVPIYKSGDEMIFTNYRPVSVLPVFSKLLERLMYNPLIEFINANNLLYEYQFGFQKGKSTHMALIVLIDKITEALDQGNCVIGIFIDFSKAFDTVNHKLLLQKMKLYGIQGTANQWFHDYLSNRYQYVTYNGVKSKQEIITCGVPQGSILGPLLFLLYVNDLYLVTKASLPVLFADDTNIFITGKNSKEMCDKINEDLENIREWLCCNKLSLNILKTHYMVFTPRNKVVNDIDICINDVPIERVYVTKFLGIQIDSQLNWKKHIDYICKKLSKCVGIIAKARKKLYKSSLITLYYSFAYPCFIYCNHVWGNTFKTSLEKWYWSRRNWSGL